MIVDNCVEVRYNAQKEDIFIKEKLNRYNYSFYQIKVLSDKPKSGIEAYNKVKITEMQYDSQKESSRIISLEKEIKNK